MIFSSRRPARRLFQKVPAATSIFLSPYILVRAGVSIKAEDAYPTGATGPCSKLLVVLFAFVILYVLF